MSAAMRDDDFDLEAGTTEFYADAVYYEHEYEDRIADQRWYAQHYADTAGEVLELGVGTGRIARRAVRQGARVVGLDLSESMLAHAREKAALLPKVRRDDLTLVQGDMRAFDLGRRFPLISCPFNAFMHMYETADARRALACVKKHLEPGGLFLMDVLMADLDYLNRPSFKRYPGVRFRHPTYRTHYTYSEQSAWDPVRQINQMWFYYTRYDPEGAGPAEFCLQLSHRYFFPAELELLLEVCGLAIVARFGDFEEGPLTRDSESQVLMCTHLEDA